MALPSWWRDSMTAQWAEARTEILASWEGVVGVPKPRDPEIAERALAMGFHARHAFEDANTVDLATTFAEVGNEMRHPWANDDTWERHLEDKLREDWEAMHPGDDGFPSLRRDLSWEQVSAAVKHGWEMSPQGGWPISSSAPTEDLMAD